MDYFELLSNEVHTADVDTIKEKIHSGTMIQAKLHHNSYNRPPFWAEIQALPFQNEAFETEYVLLLVKNVTYYHTEEFLMRLEKEMYEAIEKDNSLGKRYVLCARVLMNFLRRMFRVWC